MFTSLDEMDTFDQVIRELLKKKQDDLKMTDEALGKMAFGFMVGKRTKVQAIFVGQGADKYRKLQKLRLTDVMNLCEALGTTINDILKEARKIVKEKK